MSRFTTYTIFAVILVSVSGWLIFVFPTSGVSKPPTKIGFSVIDGTTTPSAHAESLVPNIKSKVTTSKKRQESASSGKDSQAAVSTGAALASPSTTVEMPNINLAHVSAALRAALVNIMCYAPAGSALHSISGSGVVINSKGVILTNAHVAQYFLLADKGVSCVVRSGSPAVDEYKASIEYISPAWIQANAGVLTENMPLGTGEHDYALLAITGSATPSPLPKQFPSIPLAMTSVASGTPVVIATYGAQFLNTTQIQSNLSPTVVYGSVKGLYTFSTSTADVLALGGSAAAQEGSSGGGVANANGTLVGIITTSTITGPTYNRSLNAITTSYIQADFLNESGEPIEQLLAQSPIDVAAQFATQIPSLEAVIMAALGHQ